MACPEKWLVCTKKTSESQEGEAQRVTTVSNALSR